MASPAPNHHGTLTAVTQAAGRHGAWLEGLGLLAVLALAATTRLYGLEFTVFKVDQAEFFLRAREVAEGREFPTAGTMSSAGLLNPPLAHYLFTLAYAVAPDPLGITALVAASNVLGVAILYGAARSIWGPSVALLASGMLALLPGSVHFGRFIWNPNLVMPFSSVALWGLLAHTRGRRWGMPLGVFAFLWAAQLHVFNLLATPGLALAWRLGGWRTSWKGLTLAAIAGAAPLAPYLYRFWQERPVVPTGSGLQVDTQAVEAALSLVHPGGYLSFLAGVPASSLEAAVALALLVLAAGWLGLWWVGTRAGPWRQRTPFDRTWSIPAVWGVAPPMLATAHVFPIYAHYQVGILPGLCLLVALGISRWVGAGRRAAVAAAGLLGVAGIFAVGFGIYLDSVRQNDVGRDYGAPLAYTRQAAARLATLMDEQPAARPWTYVSTRQDMRGTVEAFLGRRDVAEAWSDHFLVLPPPGQPGLHLVTEDGTPPVGLLKQVFSDALVQEAGPDERPAYSLYALPPDAASRLDGPGWRALEHRLGSAAAFEAYQLAERVDAGAVMELGLRWRVTGPGAEVPAGALTFAVLVDRQDRPWGDEAHDLRKPAQWRVGELVLDRYRIAVDSGAPSGRYWVLAGIDHEGRLTLSDGGGQPSGTAMRLGPLRVVGRPQAVQTPEIAKAAVWEGGIGLEGFDPPRPGSGDDFAVRLYWRAHGRPQHSYTVFVHLLDQEGRVVAQSDGLPQEGLLPTDFWLPGELVVDERVLSLPSGGRAGDYRLRVGWYRRETGQRLALEGVTGTGGDALELGSYRLP